jgi:very-short-patch-repair endonuclease|tara:strand:+ start:120 stop:650 length:531 start_codon:yes stop_codon:yes gene_type:complete
VTERKTLQLRDPSEGADAAPVLKKKGRGWEISEKRLDAIHERARYLRRHSTEAHKALAARFAKEDFGKYKFTRHTVVGSAILDFVSHPLGLAIAIDEEGQDDRVAKRRDKSLASVGVEVFRIPAATILDDVEAAMQPIFAAMNARYRDKETARRAHQSKYGSTPRRPRPQRRDDRK